MKNTVGYSVRVTVIMLLLKEDFRNVGKKTIITYVESKFDCAHTVTRRKQTVRGVLVTVSVKFLHVGLDT